ncbi:condensin-2 complex subunit D3 isoform X2 [Prorops nasuta]|uniref:condensin-2 complex subunit D3 isoform X2 n=1 Tax=Prorops nasuta TaxID=863751 RepID=UPI0034CFF7E2
MEPLQILENFKLNDVNSKWVDSIWNGEFTTYDEPPAEYLMFLNSEDMEILLKDSCSAIKNWLYNTENNEGDTSDVSWQTLIVLNVNVRSFLAVLGYIIKSGKSYQADEDSRQACLRATSLYLMLLAIPGSNAFNVFHPNLYKQTIETLKMSEYLIPQVKKVNRSMDLENLYMDEVEQIDELLTSSQKITLIKSLNSIMYDLILMIKSFWLKEYFLSLDITISMLVEVTKLDADLSQFQLHTFSNDATVTSMVYNAYSALQALCTCKHGPVDVTITLIAKYILPRFLFTHSDSNLKYMVNVREVTIRFLKTLVTTHESDAKAGFVTLFHHLMTKCPERGEIRQKQAMAIVKLMTICEKTILIDAIKSLLLLSHHNKTACRIFAQDIMAKFLTEGLPVSTVVTEVMKNRFKKTLIVTILSRCTDSSNMVRGRALAIIAEFTDFIGNDDENIMHDIFKCIDKDKSFPIFDDLKESLVNDIDILPGLNTVTKMLMEKFEDERALVRRSTIQIFKNLCTIFPELVDNLLPFMSRRCRDPALLVRKSAVQVLTEILQRYPSNFKLMAEWVKSVMPQVFDVEAKVQEKVIECLQDLLLNKITNFSIYVDDNDGSLPWRILNELINLKMRKHLSKACNLWTKTNIVTKEIVTNIQSHIGTQNDITAWVLLAALSESKQLPNIRKYINNYNNLLQEEFRSYMILEVLRSSWSSLMDEEIKKLYYFLFEELKEFKVDLGLISICLDVLSKIILHLFNKDCDASLESGMLKLMELSETEIQQIFKNKNCIGEYKKIFLRALSTLGHTAFLCTGTISQSTLYILEGFLLDWDSLPESWKELQELQPFTVALLGQQSMRDREIAQEIIPIFGQLLRHEVNADSLTKAAIKVNVAKALADLCVRFTALVEPYLPDMCLGMKDKNSTVREVIVVIFIQLLLEDFIKLKGPFFFHILTMLSDPEETIRELTVFLIEERLLTKNKTLISQQFLESIYHYNNYQSKHKFYDRKMRDKEKKALTFPGKKNKQKRRVIYDFMLEHLDPPGKLKLLVKLTNQVLGGVCNGIIDIKTDEGAWILKDTLYILKNERLQPAHSSNKCSDDIQEEETTTQINSSITSAVNIIIEGMKKHCLEVLLPTLAKLWKKLAKLKSPLEYRVKKHFVTTFSDYSKEQLTSLLNEYPEMEKQVDSETSFRKSKRRNQLDGESSDSNESSCLVTSTPDIRANSPICYPTPRIILRRLSSLTYSSKHLKSPSPILGGSMELSNFSGNICMSPSQMSQNLLEEPGPSTSTPRVFKSNYDSLESGSISSKYRRSLKRKFTELDSDNNSD